STLILPANENRRCHTDAWTPFGSGHSFSTKLAKAGSPDQTGGHPIALLAATASGEIWLRTSCANVPLRLPEIKSLLYAGPRHSPLTHESSHIVLFDCRRRGFRGSRRDSSLAIVSRPE